MFWYVYLSRRKKEKGYEITCVGVNEADVFTQPAINVFLQLTASDWALASKKTKSDSILPVSHM